MEQPPDKQACLATRAASACPPAGTAQQSVRPTLQDLAAVPDLGALIMAGVPLPDRVRLRGLCRAFKTSVDASLLSLQTIGPYDLLALDKRGRSNGDVMVWLASKCPNLEVLEACKAFGAGRLRRWWMLPVADDVVMHVATHCRHLQTLHLYMCKGVSDAGLRAVAANCGELRELDVGDCPLVTDAGVSAIAAGCRQLESLGLRSAVSLGTGASIVAVAAHCPRLRRLDVHGTSVGDAGIIAIARGCPDLRWLDVSSCTRIFDVSIVAVAEGCPLLEILECWGSGVGNAGIAAVMARSTHLQKLHLARADDHLVLLGPDSCRQLRSLDIRLSPDLTDAAFITLAARCPELTRVNLDGPIAVTDAGIEALAANCPLLEELCISRCDVITDAGVLAVANNCPRLHSLEIYGCERVTDASLVELARHCLDLRVVDLRRSYAGNSTLLAIAQHCPDLRSLDISGRPFTLKDPGKGQHARRQEWRQTRVQDDGLAAVLHNCLKLEMLDLSHCRGLTDAAIRMAGYSCKFLQELYLESCRHCFTARGIIAMAPNLVALRTLDASSCDAVTDVSVVALAQHCPQLTSVNVSNCQVGDEGIVALARHCPLFHLTAMDCYHVTDSSMAAISEHCSHLHDLITSQSRRITAVGIMAVASKCKKLRYLCIDHCSVTASDVQAVREACPHVKSLECGYASANDGNDSEYSNEE